MRSRRSKVVPSGSIAGSSGWGPTGSIENATARLISDIDLLVPQDEAARAWEILRANGHEPAEVAVADHFHLRQLIGPSGLIVEIHTSISNELAPDEAWRRVSDGGRCVSEDFGCVLVPSATEALWHAIVHPLHHESQGFRLRFFLDAAAILAAGHSIVWADIEGRMRTAEVVHHVQAMAWLAAAAWVAGVTLPGNLVTEPFPLRRMIAWRLTVFRHCAPSSRRAVKLVDEATRVEAGMPPAVPYARVPAWVTARRHLAATTARVTYRVWRSTHS